MRYYIILLFISTQFQLLGQQDSLSLNYIKYSQSDFDYFKDVNEGSDEYKSYYYLINGQYEESIISMKKTLLTHPNDSNIKQELVNTLVLLKRYNEAKEMVEYSSEKENPIFYFDRYPEMEHEIKSKKIELPFFNNFYTNCSINGIKDSVFLDTGVRITLMSKSYARKHNIKIDTLEIKGLLTGNAYMSNWDSGLIPSIEVGDSISIKNLPCLIVDDGVFTQFGIKNQIVFGLDFLTLFDKIEFDYLNGKFIGFTGLEPSDAIQPNFHILGLTPVTNIKLNDKEVIAFIDTGSPYTYVYQSDIFDADKMEPSKTIEKEFQGYKYTEKYFPFKVQSSICWNGEFEIKIRSNRNSPSEYKKDILIGNETWLDGSLILDFQNNHCCFKVQ